MSSTTSPPTAPPPAHIGGLSLTAHYEKAAAVYEVMGGDVTKAVSRHLIALCVKRGHAITAVSVVHDNACGPGITSGEILALPQLQPLSPSASTPEASTATLAIPQIHATDFSAAMIQVLNTKPWAHRITAAVMDSTDLAAFADATFTHSITAFAIFIFPSAARGAAEIYRTLRNGGVALVTTWAEQGFVPLFQAAQRAVRPHIADDQLWAGPSPPQWRKAETLKSVLVEGGFDEAKVQISRHREAVRLRGWQAGFEIMKASMSRMVVAAWTEEEKVRYEQALTKVFEDAEARDEEFEMVAWVAFAEK